MSFFRSRSPQDPTPSELGSAVQFPEVGKRLSETHLDLHVMVEPHVALEEQFLRLRPSFMVLHDIGAGAAARLLEGISRAAKTPVQFLSIRQSGTDLELARLQFLDLPLSGSTPVRLYTTDNEASDATALAYVLMAHSSLAVLMIGAMGAADLQRRILPIREHMQTSRWPNQHMLLMPLSSSVDASQAANELGSAGRARVQATTKVSSASAAWQFIVQNWSQIQGSANVPSMGGDMPVEVSSFSPFATVNASTLQPASGSGSHFDRLQETLPIPVMGLNMAQTASGALGSEVRVNTTPSASRAQDYVDRLSQLPGAESICLFDAESGRALAQWGHEGTAQRHAGQAQQWLHALTQGSKNLSLGRSLPEAVISFDRDHAWLRPVPQQPRWMVLVMTDRVAASIEAVRARWSALDSDWVNSH